MASKKKTRMHQILDQFQWNPEMFLISQGKSFDNKEYCQNEKLNFTLVDEKQKTQIIQHANHIILSMFQSEV